MVYCEVKMINVHDPLTEEEMRLVKLEYKNFIDVFNSTVLNKDVMREMVLKLNKVDRKCMEAELIMAATVVTVLTIPFLQNSITYLEEDLVIFVKDQLEKLHALDKFHRRLQWQKSLEYQTMKLEQLSRKMCEVKE